MSIKTVKIVTYDLNREVTRPPLLKKIKDSYPNWAKLSESSYAVSTNETPTQIFEKLKPLVDGNDNLYVITLTQPWNGYGPKEVNEWLESELTW